jgi:hypothetical protein
MMQPSMIAIVYLAGFGLAGKAQDVTLLLTAAAAPAPIPSTPLLFRNIRNVTLLVRHSISGCLK